MFADRTLALVLPFLVAASQANVIRDDPVDAQSSVQKPAQPPAVILGDEYNCKPYDDWDCYKRYYKEYSYCHPQDIWCYKDCKDWSQYKDHCYHKGDDYKCYDKCYYDRDGCDQWNHCNDYDYDCYKKRHEDEYQRKKPAPPAKPDDSYCKPWDYDCHKKYSKDRYSCNPWKDKYCYPYYYPQPVCPAPERPPIPHDDVVVEFFSPCDGSCHTHGYSMKVWPDGDEVFTENKAVVDHIKYWADAEDSTVRCLPMLNYFPWTPLELEQYVEVYDDCEGHKVRVLRLKEPQVVELVRCDFY